MRRTAGALAPGGVTGRIGTMGTYFADNRIVRYSPGDKDGHLQRGDGAAARVLKMEVSRRGEVLQEVKKLVNRQFHVGPKTYQVAVHLAGVSGSVSDTGRLLAQMKRKHVPWSTETYNAIIQLCIAVTDPMKSFAVKDAMAANDVVPDAVTFKLLLQALGKHCAWLWEVTANPADLREHYRRGLGLLEVYQGTGHPIGLHEMSLMLPACPQAAHAFRLAGKVQQKGLTMDLPFFGALVRVLALRGGDSAFGAVERLLRAVVAAKRGGAAAPPPAPGVDLDYGQCPLPDEGCYASLLEAAKRAYCLESLARGFRLVRECSVKISSAMVNTAIQCLVPHVACGNAKAYELSLYLYELSHRQGVTPKRMQAAIASTFAALGATGKPLLDAHVDRFPFFSVMEEHRGRGLGALFAKEFRAVRGTEGYCPVPGCVETAKRLLPTSFPRPHRSRKPRSGNLTTWQGTRST
ncbi:hypothetical protein DIPPA_35429 [Diplonema papillatum]|nr:hypothetical protein DIPPA_35429 [Diplonema papillatum]|eukprot:gene16052-24579_t